MGLVVQPAPARSQVSRFSCIALLDLLTDPLAALLGRDPVVFFDFLDRFGQIGVLDPALKCTCPPPPVGGNGEMMQESSPIWPIFRNRDVHAPEPESRNRNSIRVSAVLLTVAEMVKSFGKEGMNHYVRG